MILVMGMIKEKFFLFQDTNFDVQGLYENNVYNFRVSAVNEFGASEFLTTTSPIIAKMPFGMYIYLCKGNPEFECLDCKNQSLKNTSFYLFPIWSFPLSFFNTRAQIK